MNIQTDYLGSHFVQGQYFYVTNVDTLVYFCTAWGLEIYSVASPTNPQLLSQTPTDGCASSIRVSGDYAYIGERYCGLVTYDISNPTNPVFQSRYRTDGFIHDVNIRQNYAYLVDEINGLIILDVTNPANPVYLGSWQSNTVLRSVFIVDTLAYLGSFGSYYNQGALKIVSVADPTNPYLIGEFIQEGQNIICSANVQDTLAFLAGSWWTSTNVNYNFMIVSMADPANPRFISGVDFDDVAVYSSIQGNYAYVNTQQDGIRIIDISNLQMPVEVGCFDESRTLGYSSAVNANILIIPESSEGFTVVDVSNPAKPIKLMHKQNIEYRNFEINRILRYLFLTGMLLERSVNPVADIQTILQFIDIQDLLNPVIRSELFFLGSPCSYGPSLTCDDPNVAIGLLRPMNRFLAIIDGSNIDNPQLSRFEYGPVCGPIKLCSSNIYAGSSDKLYLGDIFSEPIWIDSITMPDYVHSVAIDDSIAYISCRRWLSILNLNSLSIISTYYHNRYMAGCNDGIVLDFPYLYISYLDYLENVYNGFMVFDISDPATPVLIVDTLMPEPIPPSVVAIDPNRGCCLVDSLFFLCCGSLGFEIWNVHDPSHPTRLLAQETPNNCTNIRVINDTILVMDGLSIEVYALTETGVTDSGTNILTQNSSILNVSPNPFKEKTMINYVLKTMPSIYGGTAHDPGSVELCVFDACGRLVKQWTNTASKLSNKVVWDGKNNEGNMLAQGVYFVKLCAGGQSYIAKVVLLR